MIIILTINYDPNNDRWRSKLKSIFFFSIVERLAKIKVWITNSNFQFLVVINFINSLQLPPGLLSLKPKYFPCSMGV